MVTTTQKPIVEDSSESINILQPNSLEDWLENPLDGTEWVNGELTEKLGMTLTHSKIQRRLSTAWANYQTEKNLGGEVYTEAPCKTNSQGRKPDAAYLTQDLLEKHGQSKVLPQSFPLSAEIVSPSDLAENIFAKADEYLSSGGEEVWLIFPENQRVIVMTADSEQTFKAGETAKTQRILEGFSISVDELLT
ncbi:MAG: Uma2 family endonuclease [Cyanobacteria bacterium J06606_4]